MRHLPMVLSMAALVAAAASAWPQGVHPEPPQVTPVRPPQSAILIMPVPEATLDRLNRGTLTAKFPPEVLDSVLRGPYRMPIRPNQRPLPELPFRLRLQGEIEHHLLSTPTQAPGGLSWSQTP